MTNTKNTLNELAEQVRHDLESIEGMNAIEEALASSSETNKYLSDVGWLDPKKLDEPITD